MKKEEIKVVGLGLSVVSPDTGKHFKLYPCSDNCYRSVTNLKEVWGCGQASVSYRIGKMFKQEKKETFDGLGSRPRTEKIHSIPVGSFER